MCKYSNCFYLAFNQKNNFLNMFLVALIVGDCNRYFVNRLLQSSESIKLYFRVNNFLDNIKVVAIMFYSTRCIKNKL